MTEIFCISGITYCMFIYKGSFEIRIPLLFFYSGLIVISFLQKLTIALAMNKKFFGFWGMVSYAIYVSHLQVLTKFGWIPGFDLLKNKAYSYMIILVSVIVYGIFMNYLPGIIHKSLL